MLASRYTDTAHGVVYYSAYTSTDGVNLTLRARLHRRAEPARAAGGGHRQRLLQLHQPHHVHRSTTSRQRPGSQPPPFICPAAWTCADIGGALPPGQDSLSSGTWNEIGGGGDIWGTADAFHFVSQTLQRGRHGDRARHRAAEHRPVGQGRA